MARPLLDAQVRDGLGDHQLLDLLGSRNDMTVTLWITNMGVGAGAALTASMGSAGYAVGIGLFAAIGAVAHLLRATP